MVPAPDPFVAQVCKLLRAVGAKQPEPLEGLCFRTATHLPPRRGSMGLPVVIWRPAVCGSL